MRKAFLIVLTAFAIVFCLASCKEDIVSVEGTWVVTDGSIEYSFVFNADKTCVYSAIDHDEVGAKPLVNEGTYTPKTQTTGTIKITFSEELTYDYVISGNELILYFEGKEADFRLTRK